LELTNNFKGKRSSQEKKKKKDVFEGKEKIHHSPKRFDEKDRGRKKTSRK